MNTRGVFTMLTFIMIVCAILAANIVSTVLAFMAFSSGKVRKWWAKKCMTMFEEMEELEEL